MDETSYYVHIDIETDTDDKIIETRKHTRLEVGT